MIALALDVCAIVFMSSFDEMVEQRRAMSAAPSKEAVLGRALADQLQVTPGPDAEIVILGHGTTPRTA